MGLAMDRRPGTSRAPRSTCAGRDDVEGHGIGAVGFCMGGSLALWSGALADEVKVAVGFYPAIPWERMSPDLGQLRRTSRR